MRPAALLALLALLATPALAANETHLSWGLSAGSEPRVICLYDTSSSRPCLAAGLLNSTTHQVSVGQTAKFRYWSDVADANPLPAWNYRFRNRVFVGNAVLLPDTRSDGTQWCTAATCPNYLPRDAQFVSTSDIGSIGVAGGSRASDGAGVPGGVAAIGTAGFGLSDTGSSIAWGGYFEAIRAVTGSQAFGVEIDVRNGGSASVPSPYGVGIAGHGLFIGSGPGSGVGGYGPAPTADTGAAMVVLQNSSGGNTFTWNTGIVFTDTGLHRDGSGNASAIEFAAKQFLFWYSSNVHARFGISSQMSDGGTDLWQMYASTATGITFQYQAVLPAALSSDGNLTLLHAETILGAAAPGTPPAASWVIYVDTGDANKLKAKAGNGTIVTLATP